MLATLKLLHVECCAGSFVVRHAVGPLPGKENPMGWVGPSVQQGNIMIGRRGTWCDTWLRRRAVKVDNANLSCGVPNAHAWTVAWEHALSRSICCSRPALISATHQAPLLNKQQQCDCSVCLPPLPKTQVLPVNHLAGVDEWALHLGAAHVLPGFLSPEDAVALRQVPFVEDLRVPRQLRSLISETRVPVVQHDEHPSAAPAIHTGTPRGLQIQAG